ncbi:MAG: hypothetical protein ABIN89_18505 [Chitinophagaceae bacterium]
MMQKAQNYLRLIKKVAINYFVSSKSSFYEKEYINRLKRYKIEWSSKNKNIVLTQIVEDYGMGIKLAVASNFIALKTSSNIGLYSVATKLEDIIFKNNYVWDHIYSEVYYSRLDRIFLSFGGKLVHRNVYRYNGQEKINELFIKIKNELKYKEEVLKIEVDGILMGDLIYDTYLRFNHKSTLDVNDLFLEKIIFETLNIYFNCKKIFSKYHIKALVNSYTTYIHHGIIVRLCLKRNIPVYTVGSNNSLVHKVIKDFPSHQNNHFHFHVLFENLNNKNGRLNKAASLFEKRFTGKLDPAIGYMRESAFTNNHNRDLDRFDWPNTVVLLAHCFFDSPHIYRGLLFPDFYEWITYTLDVLSKQKDINILVKPHPNGIKGNEHVFEELKYKYLNRNITFIDKKTSNNQLFQLKPKAIITGYGTAASEFAYHDIPVLSIYDNPFTSYNFVNVANSIEEYNEMLDNIRFIKIKQNKEEILEYYYMQYVFFMDGRENNYLKFNKYKGQTYSDGFLSDYLPLMNEAYFKMIEEGIRDGFKLTEWENNNVNEAQLIL